MVVGQQFEKILMNLIVELLSAFILNNQIMPNTSLLMIETIILNLTVAFFSAIMIYIIYKKTYSGVLYSKNFNVTLMMCAMITCTVVMVVSGSIALSLGLVGALSIVRFRTAVKEPKDTAFMFWTITTGIICGVSAYYLAIVSVLLIGLITAIISRTTRFDTPYLLILKFDRNILDSINLGKDSLDYNIDTIEDKKKSLDFKKDSLALKKDSLKLKKRSIEADSDPVIVILKQYCKRYKPRSTTWATNEDPERVIEVKLKYEQQNELVQEIRQLKGIKEIRLISYSGDLSTL
ncbi:MAG: DUF4956 domain-containing protein [Candidatus Helarchaeota archaeon]|nr:DUF4956 domain-containing protein [Candidatus Helarchaeota archaeon]